MFFTCSSGSKNSTLLVKFVLKSPPCVLQQTGLIFFFRSFDIYLTIIIEDHDPEYIITLSGLNLELLSLPLISPHMTGVSYNFFSF